MWATRMVCVFVTSRGEQSDRCEFKSATSRSDESVEIVTEPFECRGCFLCQLALLVLLSLIFGTSNDLFHHRYNDCVDTIHHTVRLLTVEQRGQQWNTACKSFPFESGNVSAEMKQFSALLASSLKEGKGFYFSLPTHFLQQQAAHTARGNSFIYQF